MQINLLFIMEEFEFHEIEASDCFLVTTKTNDSFFVF